MKFSLQIANNVIDATEFQFARPFDLLRFSTEVSRPPNASGKKNPPTLAGGSPFPLLARRLAVLLTAVLAALLAATALLTALTSRRLILLTGFLLTALLTTLLLAALFFATHHDSPLRNNFRLGLIFLQGVRSLQIDDAGWEKNSICREQSSTQGQMSKFHTKKNILRCGAKLVIKSLIYVLIELGDYVQ
jgi:hypothetical protein